MDFSNESIKKQPQTPFNTDRSRQPLTHQRLSHSSSPAWHQPTPAHSSPSPSRFRPTFSWTPTKLKKPRLKPATHPA